MCAEPERRKPLSRWDALIRTALVARHEGREYVAVIDFLELDKDAKLYRDSYLVEKTETPVNHAVDDVVIDVDVTLLGVKRARLRTPQGDVQMQPLPETWEYRRLAWGAKNPQLDRVIAATAWVVLAVGVVFGAFYLIERIGEVLTDADLPISFMFDFPISLPAWFLTTYAVISLLAAMDRALRMKYNWLIDSSLTEFLE